MNKLTVGNALLAGIVVLAICFSLTAQDEPMPYAPGAFGVWGWDWPTVGGDAQRSSSVRNDRWISRATVTKPGPHLVYKITLPNTARQMNSLSQPVLVQTARGLTGFKSMGFVSGSSGTAFGFDYDTSQVLWKGPLGAVSREPGTIACPGGLTAGLARPTPLVIANVTDTEAGRGVAPGNLPGARKSGTAVGAPGEGAPIVAALANAVAAPGAGRGGGPGGSGRGGGGGGGRGSSAIYAIGVDGLFHQLSMQQGFDVTMQPVPFIPANANASGLIVVDNVAYVSTSNSCGGVANGVWSLDLASPAKTVASWKTNGGSVAGNAGPAFGTDGTLYVATGDGDSAPGSFSDSLVSLEPKTLKPRDYFTPGKSEFNSSPVVFSYKGKDLAVASNRDGRLYLLDTASLGGADHKTPLATSAKFANNTTDYAPGALATWVDSSGTRWILAPVWGALATGSGFSNSNGEVTNGAVVAFKLLDQGGKLALAPAWVSRDFVSPVAPVIVNGVVFALSSGEFHTGDSGVAAIERARRSQPAVLYALDAFTGKALWNSGKTITSFAPHAAGLAVSTGQVYVVTYDSSIYAFGFEAKEN